MDVRTEMHHWEMVCAILWPDQTVTPLSTPLGNGLCNIVTWSNCNTTINTTGKWSVQYCDLIKLTPLSTPLGNGLCNIVTWSNCNTTINTTGKWSVQYCDLIKLTPLSIPDQWIPEQRRTGGRWSGHTVVCRGVAGCVDHRPVNKSKH